MFRGPMTPWTIKVLAKVFFFWDHLNSARKTVKILAKTFFFWRLLEFGRKNRSNFGEDLFFEITSIFGPNSTIFSLYLDFTTPEFRDIWAGPGPTYGSRRPWSLLHHFNVFGYNTISIVMFVCFYCYLSSAVIFFSFIFLQLQRQHCRKLF